MGRKQRAQELATAPLEASTGAMKNGVVPVLQPPLPEAIVGIEVGRETGTETGIGTVTEIGTETGTGNGTGTETGTEIETVTEIGTGTGSETETEKAPSADQTRSLNAGPLGKGTPCMCTEKT